MINTYNSSENIIKVNPPKKIDIWITRFLIGCGLISMFIFILWFCDAEHIGYAPLYYFLTFALFFKLLKMVHEWYHYWSVSVPVMPVWKTNWTVDVLTTACPGEPQEMIIRTLKAMKAIKYPHTNYLCDEGDDPVLRKACEELGVIHVTRIEKKDAKAGNINNALRQATGEICVVLDPDHEPIPEFLDRVLPYFENPEIGFVQCVQAYSNQAESFIAKGAAEQTYHFYGPMMMSMNTYGTVQVIGANCTFRRKALDSIGGHAAGLAEDMHTAMQLNAKNWKSVYVPEILTRGLVPATLSAYYKQQLKWSRGAFELLFRTYPSLFKKLNWRQKIHYMTIPLYFLFGLINLIDIMVPLLALCLAQVPWEVNIGHFALFFIPLFGMSMLIRTYAQQWLLEKKERGFHIAGGVLRTASWWILLIGFIYAIFNIKVPYIPTPKEDEHKNYWQLCIPNILVTLVCALGIWYGLLKDWTPYSIAMASYVVINSLMLSLVVLMSQQRFLLYINKKINNSLAISKLFDSSRDVAGKTQHIIYSVFKSRPVALTIGALLVFLNYGSIDDISGFSETNKQKEFGGFYAGIYLPGKEINLKTVEPVARSVNALDIISFKQSWNKKNENLPVKLLQEINDRGAIAMINWEPECEKGESENNKFWKSISDGSCNKYLKHYADMFRSYKEPVFINFAPGFDDPERYGLPTGNNSDIEFKKAWQYMYTFFNDLGISNLTWVWNPRYPIADNYYPGPKFVDWIGISCLNYGGSKNDKDWYSFSDLYNPYRNSFGKLQKPIMITEFGTVTGSNQSAWIGEALEDIRKKYEEIRSLVIYNTKKEILTRNEDISERKLYTANFNFQESGTLGILTDNFTQGPLSKKPLCGNKLSYLSAPNKNYKSSFVLGSPGKFNLVIKNKLWYIRGVAYNTEHDWRDGNMPLTRKRLEKDFTRIKEMGANTIRRYDHSIYDRNILNIAKEYDLKVLYGFWFDPKVDYFSDSMKVKKYIQEVEEKVKAYKDHPAILAWSLGNETWGLLKHKFSKPYLVKVREQYVRLIELLAQKIHELDPERPVFSCMEHEIYQLPGELVAFHDGAPSVDVIGINSYYEEQISQLNHVTWQFDSLRPYLVSEFGPKGYWDPSYNRLVNGVLIEDNETEKAVWYKEQWKNYVIAYKGYNVGGLAYCWHDRMEGSYTWFGLTDYKGRPKPSFYALKELWIKEKQELLPQFAIVSPACIIPGKENIFSAVSSTGKKQEYKYEWHLHKDEFLERVDDMEYLDDPGFVSVKIPEVTSKYKLYLYVSDKKGNVTTASVLIHVK